MNKTLEWLNEILPEAPIKVLTDIARQIDIAEQIAKEMRCEVERLRFNLDVEAERITQERAWLDAEMDRRRAAEAEVERLQGEKDAIKVSAWDKWADTLTQWHESIVRAEKAEAEAQRLREVLKSTAEFLHHCWCEVQMNEYTFQKLTEQMAIVESALDAARGES